MWDDLLTENREVNEVDEKLGSRYARIPRSFDCNQQVEHLQHISDVECTDYF